MAETLDDRHAAAYAYINAADVLVVSTAVELLAVVPTPLAQGHIVDVYDGKNANGRPVFSSRDPVNTGESQTLDAGVPVLLHEGLFVHAAAAAVTVIYRPLDH